MPMSIALKQKFVFGLKGIVFGAAVAAFSITAMTANSTSANAGDNDIAIHVDNLKWVPFGNSPAQMAVLWGDPTGDEYAILLKLPPGFTPGPHGHTADYHGVNLQGTWTHVFGDDDIRSLPPGSYVHQRGGEEHNDACAGPQECILFIHQHGPQDYIPPKQ